MDKENIATEEANKKRFEDLTKEIVHVETNARLIIDEIKENFTETNAKIEV